MKVPLKNRPISVVPGIPDYTSQEEIKIFDYAHEEPLLGEIAGHVFNKYLKFRTQKTQFGTRYEFRFGPSNPNKVSLFLNQQVNEIADPQAIGGLREAVFENACEEFLYKAFEAMDKVHKMDNSFFDRIKYVFKK